MRGYDIFKTMGRGLLIPILIVVFVSTIIPGIDTGTTFSKNADRITLPGYVEGEVLVKFGKGVPRQRVNLVVDSVSVEIDKRYKAIARITGQEYVLLKSDYKTTRQMISELSGFAGVVDVSPNYILYADTIPNDPQFNQLWGLHNTGQTGGTEDIDIDAPQAWDVTTGAHTVIVAVIDTGIDYAHPDLAPNMWQNPNEIPDGADNDGNGYIDDIHGINAITGSGDPMDDNGHGTHCSGTIGAVGNNGTGVSGVNWHVKLMGVKYLNAAGSGSTGNAIGCIDYIIDQKVTYNQNIVAINASWGGGYYNQGLKDAIDAAGSVDIVFCASAGNSYVNIDNSPHYPASYNSSNILSVTAIDHNGTQYYNYGPTSVDIGAPGRSILSTYRCQYTPMPGDIFYDNMENGAGQWSHGGTLDSWDITDAASGGLESYFNNMSYGDFWSDSPGTGYVHNIDNWLAAADDIDLSPYTGQTVYLGFDGGFQFDYFVSNDTAKVEISNDGGVNWSTLADLKSLFYGYGYYYKKHVFVIPEAYKTSQFRFRFHITSDDTDYNYYGYRNKGWIIDNIGVGTNVSCGYSSMNGTSMATPHVTGAVALMASYFSSETVSERIARLLDHTVPLPSLDGLCVSGGLLNVADALGATASITVTSPNGGENWYVNSSHSITWTSTGEVDFVRLQYSTDNGSNWIEIEDETTNDGSYDWAIPDTPSDQCLVRVSDTGGETSDESDAVFSIVAQAGLTVISPNGGENWEVGSTHDITWECSTFSGEVKIECSTDKGGTWRVVRSSTPNDGCALWTIPDAPSDNCIIRVSELDGSLSDQSDQEFSIVYPPSITVISPNGGEKWVSGTIHLIKWESTGLVGNVRIDYSTDNGGSWTEITPSVANAGGYNWTIPETPSGQCRIRVSEIDSDISDTSDAPFQVVAEIQSSITVTYPNGGESLHVGSLDEITWTSTGTFNRVDIHYTTDGGATWKTIRETAQDDGGYTWSVPDELSENCFVRVKESGKDEPSDISDGVFAIIPPVILLNSPNGGEQLTAGTYHTISWHIQGVISAFAIDYSIDGGSTWHLIEDECPHDTRTYEWLVPDTPSGRCRVRVRQSDGDSSPSVISEENFSIVAAVQETITVTSPNGGETFYGGYDYTITWKSPDDISDVAIAYSIDNGINWNVITDSAPNNGSYLWTVPETPSNKCRVRVADTDGDPLDVSDAKFSILVPFTITLTSPNGGETLIAGSTHEIAWEHSGGVDKVSLEYSTDGGTTWTDIASSIANEGTYAWTIPGVTSQNCLVRVTQDDGDYSAGDVSDAEFSIDASAYDSITVLTPNGGETLYAGSTYEITWTTTGDVGDVRVKYTPDNGETWVILSESTSNTGSFDWIIPDAPSTQCKVRVTRPVGSPTPLFGESESVFEISNETEPTITVLSPNGGESFNAGGRCDIYWSFTGSIDAVDIAYSPDGGVSWISIEDDAENASPYSWKVEGNPSDECLIRVGVGDGDYSTSDTSDSVFTIAPGPNTITVTYPDGGEVFYEGLHQEVTWTASEAIDFVDVEYSTDNGITWEVLLGHIQNDGHFGFIVPETPSETCLVRVSESGGDASDTSNAVFTIAPDLYRCGFGGITYLKNPDDSNTVLPWVEITFVSEDGTFTRQTVSNGSGYYRVPLPPQRYVVTARHPDCIDYCSAPGFFVVTGDGYQTGNFFMTRQ